ncbi:polysaccharide deacetylase family protein [Paenibacillus sp. FSL L8-0436]|uniref:polysaccharide deacetylase family protein n=1 Tax=Paenibacillus sp. FSL L8-0436 TaxID=2954686 RepID=UPI0031585034
MPVEEKSAALMIELLSLEHGQDGYRMEVGLTRSGAFTRQMVDIDELTYLQMNALPPFEGQRIRLSLYTKWDPFRQTHFSSLIKMNRTFSETLYFACSEEYISLLHRLKQPEWVGAEQVKEKEKEEAAVIPSPAVAAVPKPVKRSSSRAGARSIALRGLVLSLLLIVFLLRMDDGLFSDSAEAKVEVTQSEAGAHSSEQYDTLSVPYAPVVRLTSLESSIAEAATVPVVDEKEVQKLLYEEIELGGDSYEYALPKGYVALSFDDGPSKYTKEIVDILQAEGIAANFLFIGQNVLHYPEAVIYADAQGMAVGNHSWDHSVMTRNSGEENRNNLSQVNHALAQLIQSPVTVFRPPYGAVNEELAAEVGRQHMKVLLWNRDPEDWKADSPEEILHYFRATDPSGGIYLLHEKSITVKILPEIIQYLKSKGLKFAIFK